MKGCVMAETWLIKDFICPRCRGLVTNVAPINVVGWECVLCGYRDPGRNWNGRIIRLKSSNAVRDEKELRQIMKVIELRKEAFGE